MRMIISALAVACMAQTAGAQQTAPQVRLSPNLRTAVVPSPAVQAPPAINERGDLATVWISPVLRRLRENSEYGKDGKLKILYFNFFMVNPNASSSIDVAVQCYGLKGEPLPGYAAVVNIAPMGSSAWGTGPTNVKATISSMDQAWCALSAAKPFLATATVMTGYDYTDEGNIVPLTAGAR